MSEKRLAEVFLQSWHPLAELEQLTNEAVSVALDYWNLLLPIQERWKRRDFSGGQRPGSADSTTLTGLGIHGEEFGKQLSALWQELRELYSKEQKPVDYWKFVRTASYQETVRRAYFVSFLLTYGYETEHRGRADAFDAHRATFREAGSRGKFSDTHSSGGAIALETTETKSFYSDKLKRAVHLLLFRRGKMPGARDWELKEKVGKNYEQVLEQLNQLLGELDLEIKKVKETNR